MARGRWELGSGGGFTVKILKSGPPARSHWDPVGQRGPNEPLSLFAAQIADRLPMWTLGEIMRFVAVFTLCGLLAFNLAGCSATPGDPGFANHPLDCSIGVRHSDCQPGTAGYNSGVALNNSDDSTCRSYGLQFGTPAYAQCRQNIEAQRSANARAAALIASQANRPPPQPAPVVNTSCQNFGTTINCQTQ